MKRSLTLAAASLIAITGLSTVALADDATKSPTGTTMGAESGAATESGTAITPDTGTTGSISGEANFGDVISSIRAGKSNAEQLGSMTEVSKVNVVRVDELAQGENTTALENALTENKDEVSELQKAIEQNSALQAELEKQQVEASSVVATKTEADGSLTVFVQ